MKTTSWEQGGATEAARPGRQQDEIFTVTGSDSGEEAGWGRGEVAGSPTGLLRGSLAGPAQGALGTAASLLSGSARGDLRGRPPYGSLPCACEYALT